MQLTLPFTVTFTFSIPIPIPIPIQETTMRRPIRILSIIVLFAGLALVAHTALRDEAAPTPIGDPIRMGATMSLTGNLATQGVAAANGYRLCEADVNRAGGLLGRPIEIIIEDDASDAALAAQLYERLISQDGVDAILGPYGSTHTEAVAPVTERHRMVHISPLAATSSIWEQGRQYLFMVLPPAELFLAGLVDMATGYGLERIAVLQEDALFPRAAGAGAAARARERGLDVVMHETYARGTDDFTPLLRRIQAADAQVLAMAASSLGDFVTVVQAMKAADINVAMFGTSGAVAEFQQALGDDADFAYGLSAWEPGVPNPGSDAFVQAYTARFNQAPSFHAAGAYGTCQLLVEAASTAGSLDADALREVLLSLRTETVFGPWAVDERGFQVAHRGLFVQWQGGRRVVVWPDDLAQGAPVFPTPTWRER